MSAALVACAGYSIGSSIVMNGGEYVGVASVDDSIEERAASRRRSCLDAVEPVDEVSAPLG
jgi:hypothetical protein